MLDFPRRESALRVDGDNVRRILDDLGYAGDWQWSFDNYANVVRALTQRLSLTRHLEVGAGRDPILTANEEMRLGCAVTLNDISASELAMFGDTRPMIVCDIASPSFAEALGGQQFDLAYSFMVMEHVKDVPAMWRNLAMALQPGGVAFCHFPTLYAPPLVLNKLMPEWLSSLLVKAVFPDRADDGMQPKFPAYYNHCRSGENTIGPMLTRAGFSDYVVLPFWGYSYFDKFPGLKQADQAFTRLARAKQWRTFSSYAYVIAIK